MSYNMDYIKTIKAEILKNIDLELEDMKISDKFHIDCLGECTKENGSFDVYRFFDDNHEYLNYHIGYFQGEFYLYKYNTQNEYNLDVHWKQGIGCVL